MVNLLSAWELSVAPAKVPGGASRLLKNNKSGGKKRLQVSAISESLPWRDWRHTS